MSMTAKTLKDNFLPFGCFGAKLFLILLKLMSKLEGKPKKNSSKKKLTFHRLSNILQLLMIFIFFL
jgi:hypothetical protein